MCEKPIDDENREQNYDKSNDVKIVPNLEQRRQLRFGHHERFAACRTLAGFASKTRIVLNSFSAVRARKILGFHGHSNWLVAEFAQRVFARRGKR